MRRKGFKAEKAGNKGPEWQRESYEKTFHVLGNKLARLQDEVAGQKRMLASAGRSAERERKRLAGEKRLLEAFHRELLRKEQILMRRSEAVRASASELKRRESEADKKFGSPLNIKKELQREVASVEAVDGLVWRIGRLMMAGEVDRAVTAYESLRAAYSCLDRGMKRKLYPKLIGLHRSIREQARNKAV